MAFRILDGEPVGDAVRRVAREQIDKAVAEVEDDDLDRHETVHQVRKRCKKIRGLVRLVRPACEDTHKEENAWYRDSAKLLSYVRDAQGIIETYDNLADHFRGQLDEEAFSEVRSLLAERREKVARDEAGIDERLAEFLARMKQGRERVAGWRLEEDGFQAVAGGLAKTYRRGRKAMVRAFRDPSAENFHEWRKRAKYHWYHVKLLRCAWDGPLDALADEVHRLSDYLGDDHDLVILRQVLLAHARELDEDTVGALTGLVSQRQVELRAAAHSLGRKVHAEKPGQLSRRLGAYWEAWRRTPRVPAHRDHEPRSLGL